MEPRIDAGGSMPLAQLFTIVLRRWRVLAASAMLFVAIAAVIGFAMTPIYRSSAVLISNDSNDRSNLLSSAVGQLGGLASIAGLSLGANSQAATTEALAVMQSREFITQFIDQHQLMPKLFATKWDAAAKNWKHPNDKVPTPGKAYKRFMTDIMDVYQDKKTNLVTLAISWRDRQEAADWANEIVDMINARMRDRAIAEADDTLRYLRQELPGADTVQVRAALSSMMESQLKTKAVAAVRKQYAFRVIDRAVASDPDLPLRPHKALYMLFGLIVGLLVGIAIVFLSGERTGQESTRI